MADTFCLKSSEQLSLLSLQAPTWRLYFALFEHLKSEHLALELPEPESVTIAQARVRSQQVKELKQVKFEEIKESEEGPDEDDQAQGATTMIDTSPQAIEPASAEPKSASEATTETAVAMQSQEDSAEKPAQEADDN